MVHILIVLVSYSYIDPANCIRIGTSCTLRPDADTHEYSKVGS